ncbi:MAG TPA: hypothetical protein VMP11_06200 [Verrucomicrobiae bacterium]|nr:hypothetical protein [Verrucomicrobiae bacterium]
MNTVPPSTNKDAPHNSPRRQLFTEPDGLLTFTRIPSALKVVVLLLIVVFGLALIVCLLLGFILGERSQLLTTKATEANDVRSPLPETQIEPPDHRKRNTVVYLPIPGGWIAEPSPASQDTEPQPVTYRIPDSSGPYGTIAIILSCIVSIITMTKLGLRVNPNSHEQAHVRTDVPTVNVMLSERTNVPTESQESHPPKGWCVNNKPLRTNVV